MSWYIQALKNYTNFSGRAQRSEFWFFVLFNNLIGFSLLILDGVTSGVPALTTLFQLWTIVPAISVSARRLHDIGESGWWLLLALIPILGGPILVLFYAADSQPGSNIYGENPKGVSLADSLAQSSATKQGSVTSSALPTGSSVNPVPFDPLSNPTVYKLWLFLKGFGKLLLFCVLCFICYVAFILILYPTLQPSWNEPVVDGGRYVPLRLKRGEKETVYRTRKGEYCLVRGSRYSESVYILNFDPRRNKARNWQGSIYGTNYHKLNDPPNYVVLFDNGTIDLDAGYRYQESRSQYFRLRSSREVQAVILAVIMSLIASIIIVVKFKRWKPKRKTISHDGKTQIYYDNGKKEAEGMYTDGFKDGLWTTWHRNGKKDYEGYWKRGVEHGRWTFWNRNGKKIYEVKYQDGKEVSRTHF